MKTFLAILKDIGMLIAVACYFTLWFPVLAWQVIASHLKAAKEEKK